MTAENGLSELHKQFEVLVCTGALSFTGTLRCDFSQRLIDALNEGMRTETSEKMVRFLPLVNVTMMGTTGDEQDFPRIYIAKNSIVFVAQISDEGSERPLRTYPFKGKRPIAVTVYASGVPGVQYALNGRMYVETGSQVIDTIESDARFLPLTQVEIEPAPPRAGSRFDFVALNRDQVISICESPGPQLSA